MIISLTLLFFNILPSLIYFKFGDSQNRQENLGEGTKLNQHKKQNKETQKRQNNEAGIESQAAKRSWKH